MVKIETICRIPLRRTFGRIPWYVVPEPPATLHCAATWRIQCRDPRAMCHIAGCCHWANSTACHPLSHVTHCRVLPLGDFTVMIPAPHATLQGVIISSAILKIVFRHILFFWFFLNAVWALTSGGFCIVSDTLVLIR